MSAVAAVAGREKVSAWSGERTHHTGLATLSVALKKT